MASNLTVSRRKTFFFLWITHRFWERSHLSTDAVGMCDLVRLRILFLFFVFDIYRCKIFFQNYTPRKIFFFSVRIFSPRYFHPRIIFLRKQSVGLLGPRHERASAWEVSYILRGRHSIGNGKEIWARDN